MGRRTLLASQIDVNPDFEETELDDREREVLKFLASEQNAYFSFQGLRRRLGYHQETLTRALRRLEEAEVIERTPEGYKAKSPSSTFSFTVRTNATFGKPIIDAYLPSSVDVTILFQRLRGRWFGDFRWLGYSQDGDQLSMSWISEDGQLQLQARIGGGKIVVAAEATGEKDETRSIQAAYQLFDHVSKIAEEMVENLTSTPVAN